jgi:hypothetical protein
MACPYLRTTVWKWTSTGRLDHIEQTKEKPRWVMSSKKYMKQAVADVETELAKIDQCLPMKITTPLSQGY